MDWGGGGCIWLSLGLGLGLRSEVRYGCWREVMDWGGGGCIWLSLGLGLGLRLRRFRVRMDSGEGLE